MGFENTGRVWTVDSLKGYLAQIKKPDWCNSVTLHHTGAPSLAQRPNGLTAQHLRNIEDYYRHTKGWSSAPHLSVDEDQLWGMCDFRKKGVHAVSFNGRSIVEVLGEYDTEAPGSGRGLACWKNAAAATKVVLDGSENAASKETVFFHRDDPTTNKSCPGTKVAKHWVLGLIGQPLEAEATEPTKKPTPSVKLAKDELRFEGMHSGRTRRSVSRQEGRQRGADPRATEEAREVFLLRRRAARGRLLRQGNGSDVGVAARARGANG